VWEAPLETASALLGSPLWDEGCTPFGFAAGRFLSLPPPFGTTGAELPRPGDGGAGD